MEDKQKLLAGLVEKIRSLLEFKGMLCFIIELYEYLLLQVIML